MKNPFKQAGFTLIELVLVIMIVGIVSIVGSRMLAQGLNSYIEGKKVIEADWQGRISMNKMTRDIRAIRSANDISISTASELAFTDNTGTSIDYKLSGSTLLRNTGEVVADGVTGLSFTYYDKNGSVTATKANMTYIGIRLTVTQSGANYQLATAVYLRDLSS